MTREEKVLYHQIHPLKLLTDWTASFAALPLLWRHRLRAALLVTFVPSILIIRYVELEPYRRSAFGGYVERYMTREMQGVRLAGCLIMSLGAWYRKPWSVPLGVLVVLFGWSCGILFPPRGG